MILDTFPVLAYAFEVKMDYLALNREGSYEAALEKPPALVRKFKNSGIPQYQEFTGILFQRQEEILNSFIRPYGTGKLSNAFTKNINGKSAHILHYQMESITLTVSVSVLSMHFLHMFITL